MFPVQRAHIHVGYKYFESGAMMDAFAGSRFGLGGPISAHPL
jgi:hypothetical protein